MQYQSLRMSGSVQPVTTAKYWTSNVQKKATLEFTRDRKSMSVLCSEARGPCFFIRSDSIF